MSVEILTAKRIVLSGGQFMATKKKNRAAVTLGRLGGKARAKKLSKEELSAIGKLGAKFGHLGGRPRKKKKRLDNG